MCTRELPACEDWYLSDVGLPMCGCPQETLQHLLKECPAFAAARQDLTHSLNLISRRLFAAIEPTNILDPPHQERKKNARMLHQGYPALP